MSPFELGRAIAEGFIPYDYQSTWSQETQDLLQDFNRHAITIPYSVPIGNKIKTFIWPAGFSDIADRTTERFSCLQEMQRGVISKIQDDMRAKW